jgi:hypothetical protein
MAVTISYLYPSTTVPSQSVNPGYNMVIATVSASAAADTSAVITHDFGLPASDISQGFPLLIFSPGDGNEITSPWYEASENPNYTVLQKSTTAAGGLLKVNISRPHSITR